MGLSRQRLKQMRLDCGMTLQHVATWLGVSKSAVSKWESGKTRMSGLAVEALERLYRGVLRRRGTAVEPSARNDQKGEDDG